MLKSLSFLSKCPTYAKRFQPAYSFSKYKEQVQRANNPETMEEFWREQSKMIDWFKEPTIILDKSNPPFFRWFKDGVMNTSYNTLDRHVLKGAGNEVALIYESPVTNTSSTYTYGEMLDLVSRFANVLQRQGVNKGDKVLIYMPMIPEAIVAIQACSRIGAVHSVVFGGFSGPELASRIKDAQPKVIVTASCGIEPNRIINYKPMVEEAVQIAGTPDIKRIIVQREAQKVELTKGLDFEFYDELSKAKNTEAVPLSAIDPLYILYTSGTTGAPKGVVRDNGGNAVALSYSLKYVLDIGAGDTYFSATDIGWVTGHSFVAYGPMLARGKSVLYEGKPNTPDAGILWRLCEKHKIKGMFTSPTAVRSLRKEDPEAKHLRQADLSNLKTLLIAGERCDIPTYNWVLNNTPKHVMVADNFWQTETGWYISTNFANLERFPNKAGYAGKPSPGMNVVILDDEGHPVGPNTTGAVCLKHPTPPSFASTIYNNDKEFVRKYMSQYPGYYFTGDAGALDEDGFLHISSRLDDVINTAGHRLSTSQIEEVLIHHKDIVESAVIGAKDEIKGEVPVGFIVLKAGVKRDAAELEKECIQKVRHDIGPVAAFRHCIIVDKLPKTRSGKIVRKLLRSLANGEKAEIPATIEDASVVDAIKKDIEKHGLGKAIDLEFVADPPRATHNI